MSDLIPDAWQILKIQQGDQIIYKLLSGWAGGYLYGDSWRLNSGITSIECDGDFVLIGGYSGTTYRCSINNCRMMSVMGNILTQMEQTGEPQGISITVVSVDDVVLPTEE